jgi:hypothetical protein
VDEVAPGITTVHEPSEYHWYENGAVPPDAWDAKVTLWPTSIVGEDGLSVPATSVGLRTTLSAIEHWDAGELAESVTLYEYVAVAVGEAA